MSIRTNSDLRPEYKIPVASSVPIENSPLVFNKNAYYSSKILKMYQQHQNRFTSKIQTTLYSKVHGANKGPTWVLSASDGPHVGLMNLGIRAPKPTVYTIVMCMCISVCMQYEVSVWNPSVTHILFAHNLFLAYSLVLNFQTNFTNETSALDGRNLARFAFKMSFGRISMSNILGRMLQTAWYSGFLSSFFEKHQM